MRLVAAYIPENILPYIFGEGHEGQTLNLGGKYFYTFKETSKEIQVEIEEKNQFFIPNFYNSDVCLISAIVGQNGTGKSTLLRTFNHSIDPLSKNILQVFEDEAEKTIKVLNRTAKELSNSNQLKVETIDKIPFEPLYYSPSLDYDIADARSPIALVNYFDEDLETYFLDSVSRNVSFLNDSLSNSIKKVYKDFPDYDSIIVKVKNHSKSFFRSTYIESNFGNPHRGDALKNELEGEILRLKNQSYGNKTYSREDLIKMMESQIRFLESESFTELFTKLWNIEEYIFKDESGHNNIHGKDNFFKDIEISILSYLLLGATFPQHGVGGGFSFNKIIEATTFKERLDLFLELYLANEYDSLTKKIKELVSIDVSNVQPLLDIINNDTLSRSGGVETATIKERMISDAKGFESIYLFYAKLKEFSNNENILFDGESLTYNIKINESKLLFDELIYLYKDIIKSFPKSPTKKSFFEFKPNKKLSTGEKAILDLFASIYNYIDIYKEGLHTNYEYFLLLLDEPDLGFHPLWKKKFVDAINTTLPVLFSKMTPHVYDGKKDYVKVRENPYVQIIFTTHDSLTLSDIPNSSVVYLKKEAEFSKILKNDDLERPKNTFGANVHELLANSFFIEDGLLGEFAKEKIQDLVLYLTYNENLPETEENIKYTGVWDKQSASNLIQIVGEPIIKERLQSLFDRKFSTSEKESLELRIKELQQKLDELNEKDIN